MPDKYTVSWMSISNVKVPADNVDHAIMAAMRAAATGVEGIVETKAHPVMKIENMETDEVVLVTVDKDYKVVRIHERS